MRNPSPVPPPLTRRELTAFVIVFVVVIAAGVAFGFSVGAGMAVWK